MHRAGRLQGGPRGVTAFVHRYVICTEGDLNTWAHLWVISQLPKFIPITAPRGLGSVTGKLILDVISKGPVFAHSLSLTQHQDKCGEIKPIVIPSARRTEGRSSCSI